MLCACWWMAEVMPGQEKVVRASSKTQGKDMFLTTSKQDPHEKVEGEVSAGTRGVTAGATDRDCPPRRLINQVEDKPNDTPL